MAAAGEFDETYRRESERVLVFFARRTLDAEVALDLTAETFAQAYLGWARLRADSHEQRQAWLYTIARRQLSRYQRRGNVERRAIRRLGIQTPTAHEDDVLRAVAAGLDITRAVVDLSGRARRKFGVAIDVRVGVHQRADQVGGPARDMVAAIAAGVAGVGGDQRLEGLGHRAGHIVGGEVVARRHRIPSQTAARAS